MKELDRVGRWFTRKQLEQRRREHCAALLASQNPIHTLIADRYMKMTLDAYAAYTGKVIIEPPTR